MRVDPADLLRRGSTVRIVVGQGVADAFRDEKTPPFGEMVGQMFGQSNPQQQAGVLNQLLRSIAPGVLSTLGGGLFGRMSAQTAAGAPSLTPQQASGRTTPNSRIQALSTGLAASTRSIRKW